MNIMTKRGSEDNIVTYEHYCDTKADLANIPQDQISLGSVAIVLKDEDDSMGIYLANSNKEWISFSAGGGNGGTSEDTDKNDIPREMENEILAGTISVYTNPTASVVNGGTFGGRSTLTHVEMPKCTTVGANAFGGCSNLQTVSFPECTNIGAIAFMSCTSLETAYFPECVSIADANAFANTALTKADFPKCTYIGATTFMSCTKLSEINFPMVETIGANAFLSAAISSAYFPKCTSVQYGPFVNCSQLTYIDFPALTSFNHDLLYNTPVKHVKMNALSILPSRAFVSVSSTIETVELNACEIVHSNAFYGCQKLQYVNMPACKTLGTGLSPFGSCFSLSYVSFPKCETINSNCFPYCSALQSAYFLTSSIPTMQSTDTFFNTPISGTGSGHIYVKASLASAFKTASNWSAYSSKIVGLTDEEIATLDANN